MLSLRAADLSASRSYKCVLACVAVFTTGQAVAGYGQSVDSIFVRNSSNTFPVQTCGVARRSAVGKQSKTQPAKFDAATRDSIVLKVLSADGFGVAATPAPIEVRLNGNLLSVAPAQGATASGVVAVAEGTARTFGGGAIELQNAGQSICSVTLAPTEPNDGAIAAITFRFGPEYTSANAFTADKRLAATAGVRWDVSQSKPEAVLGIPWLKIGGALIATFDYTSAVVTRDHRSCRANAIIEGGTQRAPLPPQSVCGPYGVVTHQRRGAPEGVLDTNGYGYPVLASDSTRAQTLPTWRGVLSSRIEIDLGSDLRFGPVAGVVLQTDPRGLRSVGSTNTNRPLRPLFLGGVGLRKVSESGVEAFALDVQWGGNQNYYESDVVVVPREVGKPDTILKIAANPIPVSQTFQWQVIARLRLFKGASLRAFATLNSPQHGIPLDVPTNGTLLPAARGYPDIVRVAFLLDRDIKKVWDTLIGADGAKEGGGTGK